MNERVPDTGGAYERVKRTLDVCLSLAALVLLSPMMLALALLVRLTSDGPAIYAQERIGRHGRRFRLLKFRSMRNDADKFPADELAKTLTWNGAIFKGRGDPRVTPIGRFLRRTSLDELPQLVNVLRGEMSLVGPRPSVAAEVERFGEAGRIRLAVRPGITGLWQISGRSDLPPDAQLRLDSEYVASRSLRLDLLILLKTLPAIVSGRGAY